jgi:hypothetical protein
MAVAWQSSFTSTAKRAGRMPAPGTAHAATVKAIAARGVDSISGGEEFSALDRRGMPDRRQLPPFLAISRPADAGTANAPPEGISIATFMAWIVVLAIAIEQPVPRRWRGR